MPAIAAHAPLSLANTARVGVSAAASSPKTQTSQLKNDVLAPVDQLVVSTAAAAFEEGAISLFGGFKDTQSAMLRHSDGPQAMISGSDLLHSVKRSMMLRGVTSSARNGWKVMRGSQDLKQATGHVVADVTTTAVSGTVGSLTSHATVWALSKTALPAIVVKGGGIVAGWGANTLTHMGLRKLGVQGYIAEKTTAMLD